MEAGAGAEEKVSPQLPEWKRASADDAASGAPATSNRPIPRIERVGAAVLVRRVGRKNVAPPSKPPADPNRNQRRRWPISPYISICGGF